MLLPAQIGVPMEQIRVLAGDVGGGFGLKNGVAREDVAVVAASIDLGRPVKWIEDRLEHLAAGGQAREERADIEAAVTADGVLLGRADGRQAQHRRLRLRPVPGRDLRRCRSAARSRARPRSRASPRTHTAVFSNKATYVAYRGPWATGDFLRERLLDIVARELGLDPLDVRRRNYVARGTSRRSRCSPASRSSASRPSECVEQAATVVDWDGFRRRQAAARAEGRYLGIGIATYIEAAPGPEGPGPGGQDARSSATRSRTSRSSDDGTSVIVTRQQPHGQGHETTLAQVAADELGVPFEDVQVRLRRHRRHADGAGRHRRQPGGDHGERRRAPRLAAAAGARSSSLAADVLEASAADLEIARRRHQRAGHPECRAARWPSWPGSSREEPDRLPDGADTELDGDAAASTAARAAGRAARTAADVEVDVETGLVDDRPLRRRRGLRRRPSTRPSSRARSAAASPRGSAPCSSSTRPTTRTASSWRPRSWTT